MSDKNTQSGTKNDTASKLNPQQTKVMPVAGKDVKGNITPIKEVKKEESKFKPIAK